jgi:hypothetical protein
MSSCPPPAPKITCDSTCCISNPVITSLTWTHANNVGGGVYYDGIPPQYDLKQQCSLDKSCLIFKENYCKFNNTIRVIISVIALKLKNGATPNEILDQHNNITCPSKSLTLSQVQSILKKGVSKGIFILKNGAYFVYAHFGSLPSNQGLLKELGPNYQCCLGIYGNS